MVLLLRAPPERPRPGQRDCDPCDGGEHGRGRKISSSTDEERLRPWILAWLTCHVQRAYRAMSLPPPASLDPDAQEVEYRPLTSRLMDGASSIVHDLFGTQFACFGTAAGSRLSRLPRSRSRSAWTPPCSASCPCYRPLPSREFAAHTCLMRSDEGGHFLRLTLPTIFCDLVIDSRLTIGRHCQH